MIRSVPLQVRCIFSSWRVFRQMSRPNIQAKIAIPKLFGSQALPAYPCQTVRTFLTLIRLYPASCSTVVPLERFSAVMTRSYFPSWRAAVAKSSRSANGRFGLTGGSRTVRTPRCLLCGKTVVSNDCMHLLISDRQALFQTEFSVNLGVGEQRTD
jgi:hypothetical protein